MTTLDVAWLVGWLGRFLWALARVGGLCLVVPVFGASVIPMRIRAALVVVLTAVLTPLAPATANALGLAGMLDAVTQIAAGAAVGFVLKLVFEAVAFGGGLVGQSMGLGFAEVVDPQEGQNANVLGQFYLILVTLVFLALDGHLQLVALLADSFRHLPAGAPGIDANGLHAVLVFVSQLFGGAVRVALPAMTALLVVNVGFAAISRAAPSMNLFAVGFPISVTLGFVALWFSLRALPGAFDALQTDAWALMRQLFGG
ncbi:MAG TPA: flagellar biosynthetic protein FliR [Rhodanobacter sp.]|nr:flagellar biosynthetic protein FliR [Rhodanobacter sp.]